MYHFEIDCSYFTVEFTYYKTLVDEVIEPITYIKKDFGNCLIMHTDFKMNRKIRFRNMKSAVNYYEFIKCKFNEIYYKNMSAYQLKRIKNLFLEVELKLPVPESCEYSVIARDTKIINTKIGNDILYFDNQEFGYEGNDIKRIRSILLRNLAKESIKSSDLLYIK